MVKIQHKYYTTSQQFLLGVFGPEIEQSGKCYQTDLLHIKDINRYNAEKSRTEAELRGEDINEDYISFC